MVYEGDKCPNCGSQEHSVDIKGKIVIFDPEKSEIAQKLKLEKKGTYATRTS